MKIFGIAVGGVFLALIAFTVISYFSYANSGVDHEEGIRAQVSSNKAKYSEFTQTAVDQMAVADASKEALKEVIIGGIEGRYGGPGQKSVPAFVQENYPGQFDNSIFVRISQVIESGRRDFTVEQKQLIGRVQGYRSDLRKPWSKMWYTFAGFPEINLDEPQYNPIITAQTGESFNTGVDKGIQFNKK